MYKYKNKKRPKEITYLVSEDEIDYAFSNNDLITYFVVGTTWQLIYCLVEAFFTNHRLGQRILPRYNSKLCRYEYRLNSKHSKFLDINPIHPLWCIKKRNAQYIRNVLLLLDKNVPKNPLLLVVEDDAEVERLNKLMIRGGDCIPMKIDS